MEFHDVLHGHIVIEQSDIAQLMSRLLNTTELQRLRNMRQMNFDVPLIQELGRSRRLPHSIGVAHIALKLAQKSNLSLQATKELVSAALLHDAAIPPYGHLVETEFKTKRGEAFDHAKILKSLIYGAFNDRNTFLEILPHRQIEVGDILHDEEIDLNRVLDLVAPSSSQGSALAADIDLDNIDNVHRMAALLGWEGVKENIQALLASTKLEKDLTLRFEKVAESHLSKWLDFRQRIYTLIIAHPECIPQNALQADLVELAVDADVITPDHWYHSEPIFEENLRNHEATRTLATQLVSGCEYELADYVWIKDIKDGKKLKNSEVKNILLDKINVDMIDCTYFIWYEKGLISREIKWIDTQGDTHVEGSNSASCMIALVKQSKGGLSKFTNKRKSEWREAVTNEFVKLADTEKFNLAFPEDFSGSYFGPEIGDLSFEF